MSLVFKFNPNHDKLGRFTSGATGEQVYAFHGTSLKALDSILENGITPGGGGARGGDAWAAEDPFMYGVVMRSRARPPSSFVIGSLKEATQFAQMASEMNQSAEPIILEVAIPKDAYENEFKVDEVFSRDGGDNKVRPRRTEKTIPPSWIKGVAFRTDSRTFVEGLRTGWQFLTVKDLKKHRGRLREFLESNAPVEPREEGMQTFTLKGDTVTGYVVLMLPKTNVRKRHVSIYL